MDPRFSEKHHVKFHSLLAFLARVPAIATNDTAWGGLPTVFKPVSPPPYLNGGPDDYLAWVIETDDVEMRPGTVAKWLQSRLPDPVDDPAAWPD